VNQQQQQTLENLAARRWRVALALTAAMLIVYFGFIALVAFDKPLMGKLVLGGRISVGIILGALVIITGPALIGVYVRWANRGYDHELQALRHQLATTRPVPRTATVDDSALPLVPPPSAIAHEEARP